jgi:hypothetical protein
MTRNEILQALEKDRADLQAALARVPDDVIETRRVAGDWTIKDLLGHIAMWQQVGVQFIAEYRADGLPKNLGLKDDAAIDAYNARGWEMRRDWTLTRTRVELDMAQRNLIAAVQSLTDQDLGKSLPPPWASGTTLEKLIAINSYAHDPEHVAQIAGWQKNS